MIARPLRLRRPFDFEHVRRHGRSWSTPLVVLVTLPNALEHNRYGFAVGRRIGKATARNRVKRRLREAVRDLHPSLRPGYDVVVIARGPLANPEVSQPAIIEALDQVTRRANLRREDGNGPRPARSHQDTTA